MAGNNGHDTVGDRPIHSRPSTPEEVARGKTDMIITVHERQVIVRFPQPMVFVTMEPENARNIAEAIARAAYEAFTGKKAPPAASELAQIAKDKFTEQVRLKLIHRIALILNSENVMAMTPKDRAMRVVDACMKEIA